MVDTRQKPEARKNCLKRVAQIVFHCIVQLYDALYVMIIYFIWHVPS